MKTPWCVVSMFCGVTRTVRVALLVMTLMQAASAPSTTVSPGDDLQAVLNNALSGDVFILADGTYTQPSSLVITKSVTIQAQNPGFAILSGESKRVVIHVNSGLTRVVVIFDGLRITAGKSEMTDGIERTGTSAGGVQIECCVAVTFRNCRLDRNEGDAGGAIGSRGEAASREGGVEFGATDLVIENCVIEQNEVNAQGGGIYARDGDITITNTRIVSNRIVGYHDAVGGAGLDVSTNAVFRLSQVTFVNNTVSSDDDASAVLSATAIKYSSQRPGAGSYLRDVTVENHGVESHDTSIPTIYSEVQLPWKCPLGMWMQESGVLHKNFVGCAFNCSAGTYGKHDNLTTSACSAPCPAGHYCPAGTSRPAKCPAGTFNAAEYGASNLSCVLCSPGQYGATTGQITKCKPCEVGKLSDAIGATACSSCPSGGYCGEIGAASIRQTFVQCPTGTYGPLTGQSSLSACIQCPEGKANPTKGLNESTSCVDCVAGTYNDRQKGQQICIKCPAGKHQSAEGSTKCTPCPSQSYCPRGAAIPIVCPSGTFNELENATSIAACRTCEAGKWCTGGRSIPCAKDTFNPLASRDASDQSFCRPCPGNSTTDTLTAATSILNCKCMADFYNSNISNGDVHCETCPSGTTCGVGTTLQSLPVKRGYYRRDQLSNDVRRCPDAAANCSSTPECAESTSGCAGSVPDSEEGRDQSIRRQLQVLLDTRSDADGNLCRPGLTGVFCMECDLSNISTGVYYSPASASSVASCDQCGEAIAVFFSAAFGVLLGILLATCIFAWWYRRIVPPRQKKQVRSAWLACRPVNKAKIAISFYMIVTRIDTVYEVNMPIRLHRMFHVFSITASLGLTNMTFPLQCLGWHGFMPKLLFWMVAPALMAALLLLLVFSQRMVSGRFQKRPLEVWLPWILRLAFLCYPIVTNVAFEAWPCYEFDGGAIGYLKADVSITCGTPHHVRIQILAWCAVIIYPIGLLVAAGLILFASRNAIQTTQPTSFSRASSFLHSEYEPHLYWWELVELLRRLVLVGLMVLLQGSTMQLILGTLVALIFFLFAAQAQPYVSMFDDYFASLCSFSIVVCFLVSFAFKESALLELPDIQAKMSHEQKEIHVLNYELLTLIMAMAVLSTMLLSLVLFGVQLAREAKRWQTEKRAAKARRLRYLDSREEVQVTELPSRPGHLPKRLPGMVDTFHLFLSHNWTHGQAEMRIVKTRLLEMMPELSIFLDVDVLGQTNLRDFEHVDVSAVMLCFLTQGFMQSGPCAREAMRAVLRKVPIIAVLQSDKQRGGISEDDVREALSHGWLQDAKHRAGRAFYLKDQVAEWAQQWGDCTVSLPTDAKVIEAVFESRPLVWYNTADFQDVTMRLIAERLLPGGSRPRHTPYQQVAYMQDELSARLAEEPILLPRFRRPRRFHLFCSPHNLGAAELAAELKAVAPSLCWTTDVSQLAQCEMSLVYLTSATWTRERASEEFADEVGVAMEMGVRLMLAHEVQGCRSCDGESDARHGCEFGIFFDQTPKWLIAAGIYNTMIAFNLASDEWRTAGLIKLSREIAQACGSEQRPTAITSCKDIDKLERDAKRREASSRQSAPEPEASAASGFAGRLFGSAQSRSFESARVVPSSGEDDESPAQRQRVG